MLRVKTYLDKSPIHGIGVFAGQNIRKGETIWRFAPVIDKIFEVEEIIAVEFGGDKIINEFIDTYSYYDIQLNKWILSGDNDRFTNHSETPNTRPSEDGDMVAAKDIIIGEELTTNYFDIDKHAIHKLYDLYKDKT